MSSEGRRRNRSYSPDEDFEEPLPKRTRGQCQTENADGADFSFKSCEEVVACYAPLATLPPRPPKLTKPTSDEIKQLEKALEFDSSSERWRDDWAGNLAYADHEITNPVGKGKKKQQSFRQSLLAWAAHSDQSKRLLRTLVCFVCAMDKTPSEAKHILSAADFNSVESIESAIRRTCYDPAVLRQDGWVTSKSDEPTGPIGGPFLIGDMIRWQNSDAVIIAFVHDNDLGDLWKACWVEDMNTFDLEAEELVEARRKWERKWQRSNSKGKVPSSTAEPTSQVRANGSGDFRVAGIHEGIVLASSLTTGARPGVFWPARVMHATEALAGSGTQLKRSIAKHKVLLVFLAPYWGAHQGSRRVVEALSEQSDAAFAPVELFQFESAEANEETIKEYPFDPEDGVDLSKLEVAFRFTGLPKGAFRRFVDSHRMALGLKLYARTHLRKETSAADRASFGLFDSHPLSVMAPSFPQVVLHLPFPFILSQLPVYEREAVTFKPKSESVLNLSLIVESMKPPACWGVGAREGARASSPGSLLQNPEAPMLSAYQVVSTKAIDSSARKDFGTFLSTLPLLEYFFAANVGNPAVEAISVAMLKSFAAPSREDKSDNHDTPDSSSQDTDIINTQQCLLTWATLKSCGEDLIASLAGEKCQTTMLQWRKLAEQLFCYLAGQVGDKPSTTVLTDPRCNLHVTRGSNFERSVRLPAALKGAKLAAADSNGRVEVIQAVKQNIAEYVETSLLPKVHDSSYLKRVKARCMSAKTEDEILMLTEDSNGAGGEDTRGCRGSWDAAVHGVAVAVSAVEKVVRGKCVNVFCATRPPGHHAGRKLHAMKAVSNGFCILNAVACVAVHSVSPVIEGGLGLRRVCVIDFDVHHGNGTQDVLCSAYDPRFLYVSIHAGGVELNGASRGQYDEDPSTTQKPKKVSSSIFPGTCGDTSPHKGVLNIPLGAKVTSHAVGDALLTKVTPAVDLFCPDLIILSAGFDAHKNDPMGLGALTAEDFGHITEVACQLAFKSCSGRIVSVLEGGYGIPCCRMQNETSLVEDCVHLCQPASDGLSFDKKNKSSTTEKVVEMSNFGGGKTIAESETTKPNESTQAKGTTKESDAGKEPSNASNQEQSKAKVSCLSFELESNCINSNEATEEGLGLGAVNAAGGSTEDLKLDGVEDNKRGAAQRYDDGIQEKNGKKGSGCNTPVIGRNTPIPTARPQPSKLVDLGELLPDDMDDQVPLGLQRKLEKCHEEGFIECVREHVAALARCGAQRSGL